MNVGKPGHQATQSVTLLLLTKLMAQVRGPNLICMLCLICMGAFSAGNTKVSCSYWNQGLWGSNIFWAPGPKDNRVFVR